MIKIHFPSPEGMTQAERQDLETFIGELPWRLPPDAQVYSHITPSLKYIKSEHPFGGGTPSVEILIALAGVTGSIVTAVITAIYQSINKYMERDANREITVEKDGKRITLKGHSMPELKELFNSLYPEVFIQSENPPISRIDHLAHRIDQKLWFPEDEEERNSST
jgi:hypothetical protein